jgi:hypothetical protein
MNYFYIRDTMGLHPYSIKQGRRILDLKPSAWPYECMYPEEGTRMAEMTNWLEVNCTLFVVSKMLTHRGSEAFGGPHYAVWIDNEDESIQFKLTWC